MRAKEFVINIPISIKINSDGEPEIDMDHEPVDDDTGDFVPPIQQAIELQKKNSDVSSIYDKDSKEQTSNSLKHLSKNSQPLA